MPERDYWLC